MTTLLNTRTDAPAWGVTIADPSATGPHDLRTVGPVTGLVSARITVGTPGTLVVTYADQQDETIGAAVTISEAVWTATPSRLMQVKIIHATSTAADVLVEY